MSNLIQQIYSLRRDFVIIALTGRTGSGCTTVANMLTTRDFSSLKSNHREKGNKPITNDIRKQEIIYNFLTRGKNWLPFVKITASDVIFWYALQLSFDEFRESFSCSTTQERKTQISTALQEIKDKYDRLHADAGSYLKYICDKEYYKEDEQVALSKIVNIRRFIFDSIPDFRKHIATVLNRIDKKVITGEMQRWGNNIRQYNSVIEPDGDASLHEDAPACLAKTINRLCKAIRWQCNHQENKTPTRIVIDALRNPFEILYFRERFAAFYTMAVNTDKETRYKKLSLIGIDSQEAEKIDEAERSKGSLSDTYQRIDVDRCIELSDIYLTHDGTDADRNRDLVSQIAQYVALILHPGLVPPSPIERVMQVAHAAKLNSGCLSRQVGAAVTNESFSVQSIGWNTVAEGQTPCNLRSLYDLAELEDELAYSAYERDGKRELYKYAKELTMTYVGRLNKMKKNEPLNANSLISIGLPFCFKDLYTTINPKQRGNQVHTRSLHAEENAFLQLAKYGTSGIHNGKLFTTASCCELCGKKAYQLGIKEIYYIDSYPGITQDHILNCGTKSPKMILFHGAIGSAYNSLYEPFIPLKDEIVELSGINPKKPVDFRRNKEQKGDVTALLVVVCDNSKEMRDEFIAKIKSKEINQWVIDEDNDITIKDDSLRMLGWIKIVIENSSNLEFRFIHSTKYDKTNLPVDFMGRLISTLSFYFRNRIKSMHLD